MQIITKRFVGFNVLWQ